MERLLPDPWAYGRNPNNRLDAQYLRAAGYPEVIIQKRGNNDISKCRTILWEHIASGPDNVISWVFVDNSFFFLNQEDADLFRTLLYIY